MSPWSLTPASLLWRFPRVSGDEPANYNNRREANEFSPRERG